MYIAKNIILTSSDLIKKYSLLSKLSQKELKGFVSSLTKLRLCPTTVVKVPYHLGRTVRGVSFDKNIFLDPAGRMCKEIFEGLDNFIIRNNLIKVLEEQQGMSAADIVHLSNNVILKNYPAWAIVMPWERLEIKKIYDSYPQTFFKNRIANGLFFEKNSRSSIIKTMYSSKFAENRIKQMNRLYKSIMQKGIISSSNFPKINILIKNGEWRWFMGDGGNHRSYVFAFLGHKFFDARVSAIIDINEVNKWHNVRNGTYSLDDAKNIFDSYFDGHKVFRGMV